MKVFQSLKTIAFHCHGRYHIVKSFSRMGCGGGSGIKKDYLELISLMYYYTVPVLLLRNEEEIRSIKLSTQVHNEKTVLVKLAM